MKRGAQLGPDLGRLSIIVNCSLNKRVKEAFHEDKPDHRILSAAIEVAEQHKDMRTIFVTKDINLRMKARALGIETEDYTNDKVKNDDLFANEHRTIIGVAPDIIDAIYSSKKGIPAEQIGVKLRTNECFVLDSGTLFGARSLCNCRRYGEESDQGKKFRHRTTQCRTSVCI